MFAPLMVLWRQTEKLFPQSILEDVRDVDEPDCGTVVLPRLV